MAFSIRSPKTVDEFGFIAALLAPLASTEKSALGLKDDAAVLRVPKGCEMVVTKDALVQGVHFIGDEAPGLIAQKALRVNLSDLAAMGAKPWGYFLALMLPPSADASWRKAFAAGLRRDQKAFGITLMGGDTTSTSGPLSLSITAIGLVPQGKALKRKGAKAGDGIYVSGIIGDAALGLKVAGGQWPVVTNHYLLNRYRLPEPRLKLGMALQGVANACMDISDGLMQDLGHICSASKAGAEIHWDAVPLSKEAREMLTSERNPHETVLAGGDDYELLFTAPASSEAVLKRIAKSTGTAITRIGRMTRGKAVKILDGKGKEIALSRKGWRHF